MAKSLMQDTSVVDALVSRWISHAEYYAHG